MSLISSNTLCFPYCLSSFLVCAGWDSYLSSEWGHNEDQHPWHKPQTACQMVLFFNNSLLLAPVPAKYCSPVTWIYWGLFSAGKLNAEAEYLSCTNPNLEKQRPGELKQNWKKQPLQLGYLQPKAAAPANLPPAQRLPFLMAWRQVEKGWRELSFSKHPLPLPGTAWKPVTPHWSLSNSCWKRAPAAQLGGHQAVSDKTGQLHTTEGRTRVKTDIPWVCFQL